MTLEELGILCAAFEQRAKRLSMSGVAIVKYDGMRFHVSVGSGAGKVSWNVDFPWCEIRRCKLAILGQVFDPEAMDIPRARYLLDSEFDDNLWE